jgi:predicted outer membrane repeat protein
MKKQIMITILFLAAILVSVSACSAANLTVGTGGTYSNIQDAYDAAADDGDTIVIANGSYTGTSNKGITISKNINITGQSQTGTIIDAQGASYIFYIDEGYTVTISQLTLRNGNTTSSGGAIYNNGTLTINKCTFENNNAPSGTAYIGDGGAIYNNRTGDLTVIDSIFSGNKARWAGGAIASSGTLTVVNSRFTGNNASHGGAIHNYQGTLTVTGSNFSGNEVIYHGGAIYNLGAFTLINSNFTANNANDYGGAIYHYRGTLTVTGSNFSGNDAYYGGAIRNDDELIITGSTYTNNYARIDGGALYNYGPCTITGCTFTGNEAYYDGEYVDEYGGGAIHNENALTIKDSKFIANTATGCSGGAIYACCGDITLLRCIFDGNTADYGGAIYDYGNSINITGCNFYNNTAEYGGAIYCDQYLVIKYSRFVRNTAKELGQDIYMYNAEYPSDARYNWWGSNSGPAEGRIMTGKTSADSEIYGPWLVMNIDADPSTIYTGKTSKISANVYIDSNGADHSSDADMFFSGPEVTFTTDLGNVGSKSVTVPWTLGMAFAILIGDEGPGLATLTAADVETLSTTVNILQAPVTPDEDDELNPSENEVDAASNTIGMQETGIPIAGLILAIFAIFGGLVTSKRK